MPPSTTVGASGAASSHAERNAPRPSAAPRGGVRGAGLLSGLLSGLHPPTGSLSLGRWLPHCVSHQLPRHGLSPTRAVRSSRAARLAHRTEGADAERPGGAALPARARRGGRGGQSGEREAAAGAELLHASRRWVFTGVFWPTTVFTVLRFYNGRRTRQPWGQNPLAFKARAALAPPRQRHVFPLIKQAPGLVRCTRTDAGVHFAASPPRLAPKLKGNTPALGV